MFLQEHFYRFEIRSRGNIPQTITSDSKGFNCLAAFLPLYCGCSTSSITTLPFLSAVMTLCTGAYPVKVMSIS